MADRFSGSGFVVGPDGPGILEGGEFTIGPDVEGVGGTARGLSVGGDLREWPEVYERVATYPNNVGLDWMAGNGTMGVLQGVACDGAYWFFTTTKYLYKVPISRDLASTFEPPDDEAVRVAIVTVEGDILVRRVPPGLVNAGYGHFGDLDIHAGLLFIPLENGQVPSLIACFRADSLQLVGWAELPGQAGASSCAVNPVTGLLHVATSDDKGERHLSSYRIEDIDAGRRRLLLEPMQTYLLRDEDGSAIDNSSMQGMAFSACGHLYVAFGGRFGFDEGMKAGVARFRGLIGFDLATQSVGWRVELEPRPFIAGQERQFDHVDLELEGLAICDLDGGDAPGITGQIHLLEANHDWPSTDALRFHHWTVAPQDKARL